MKYFLMILFSLSSTLIISQDRPIFKDQLLTQAILDKVISPDLQAKSLHILMFNSKESLSFLSSHKPKALHNLFNYIIDSSEQKKIEPLLEKSYLIDTSVQHYNGININYIRQSDKNIMSYGEHVNAEIIYNFHLIFSSNKQKCLVYYQLFKEGGSVAILEKVNKAWKVIKKEVAYVE